MIGRAKFTHDELVTAVTENESILNSCPISDIMFSGDLEEPLTPSHLMVGRRLLNDQITSVILTLWMSSPSILHHSFEQMNAVFALYYRPFLDTMEG